MKDTDSSSNDKAKLQMNMENGQVALLNGEGEDKSLHINIKCGITDNASQKVPVQRNLNLSIDFIFKVVLDKNESFNEDVFKELTQDYALNFCTMQLQDIIKDITSIDYGSAIIIKGFPLPTGISIAKEAPTNNKK